MKAWVFAACCLVASCHVAAATAQECATYKHADKPWYVDLSADGLTMRLVDEAMLSCEVAGSPDITGTIPLACGDGADAFESWYRLFSGPQDEPGLALLWGNEVYYQHCE